MSIPQDAPPVATYPPAPGGYPTSPRPGRALASAIAVFLGGYLLLASFSGQLGVVSMNFFSTLTDRPVTSIPGEYSLLLVLQFLFAIGVVVFGLQIGGGPSTGRLLGSILVVAGSLLTFALIGMRISGMIRIPQPAGMVFQSVFANSWFAVVLIVGIAWLLTRRTRVGWLVLLATLVLIPLPVAFQFANISSGIILIVMFLLSGIIGAAIILAGRPLRD